MNAGTTRKKGTPFSIDSRIASWFRRTGTRDAASSEVIGSLMLIGVTVSLVSVAAFSMQGMNQQEEAATAKLATVASGLTGQTTLNVLHAGGDVVDLGHVRALILVNGTASFDGLAGAPGSTWRLGETIAIGPLANPLPTGAIVSITLVDKNVGKTIATSEIALAKPSSTYASGTPTFTLTAKLNGGATQAVIEPPAGLLVEATVNHSEGRKFVRFVYVDLSPLSGARWFEMRDDGTEGDRLAGDGVWSAMGLVPTNFTTGLTTVKVTAVDFNGAQVNATAAVTLLPRTDVNELTLNPTGAPVPTVIPSCPSNNSAISGMRYVINGASETTRLAGMIRPGDHVKAYFTIPQACSGSPVEVTLASYKAPSAVFSWSNGTQYILHQFQTGSFGPGNHSLEVVVPDCYFSLHFARGSPLVTFGPESTNNYYSRQARLIAAENGGAKTCV